MIKAYIKYSGNKSGMLAKYYDHFQLLGKFETEDEVQKAFQEWIKLSKISDWDLQIT